MPISELALFWSEELVFLMKRMNLIVCCSVCLSLATPTVIAQGGGGTQKGMSQRYVNESLRFRYTEPRRMIDKTERFRQQITDAANLSGNSRSLQALLAMSSGADSTASNWGSITIETYPRSWVLESDDRKAEAQMNAWIAQTNEPSAYGHSAVISGQSFMVSVFGRREGTVTKGAVVWTTVRKGELLSFAFAANSPELLKSLTESMKSVQFY